MRIRLLAPMLALSLLLTVSRVPGAEEAPVAPERGSTPAGLDEKDARRLFLDYINDRRNLIRNCMFLGGVRIEGITMQLGLATARIRYRIECSQEEITMPPLDRTLRENFVYRKLGEHWEILGRESELPPGLREGNVPPGPTPGSPAPDPQEKDRKALAEAILSWAVLGEAPQGVKKSFPGGNAVLGKAPVLVSDENLGGLADLALRGMKVVVLGPEALLVRTVLEKGGVWFRFETLEIEGESARVQVSLVAPVLPAPPPGGTPTRILSRMEADFLREGGAWILTRFRPLN